MTYMVNDMNMKGQRCKGLRTKGDGAGQINIPEIFIQSGSPRLLYITEREKGDIDKG